MKTLCLVLIIGITLSGCSRFTAAGRMDRAYAKHMRQIRHAKDERRQRLSRQAGKIPSPDARPQFRGTEPEAPQSVSTDEPRD